MASKVEGSTKTNQVEGSKNPNSKTVEAAPRRIIKGGETNASKPHVDTKKLEAADAVVIDIETIKSKEGEPTSQILGTPDNFFGNNPSSTITNGQSNSDVNFDRLDENSKILDAIKLFVKDLCETFSSKTSVGPLALYGRMAEIVKPTDTESIMKFITGFEQFFTLHWTDIVQGNYKNISDSAKIVYGTQNNKIYIPIHTLINKANPEVKEYIRQHLLTIGSLTSKDRLKNTEIVDVPVAKDEDISLPGIDQTSNEGRFMGDMLKKAFTSVKNVDASNPMAAMFSLMQSGVMTDMINGIHQGVGTGQMDLSKLLGVMQGAMQDMTKDVAGGTAENPAPQPDPSGRAFRPEGESSAKNADAGAADKEKK